MKKINTNVIMKNRLKEKQHVCLKLNYTIRETLPEKDKLKIIIEIIYTFIKKRNCFAVPLQYQVVLPLRLKGYVYRKQMFTKLCF